MSGGWRDLPIHYLPTVSTYSLLPDAGANTGAVYAVVLDESPNPSGIYYSDGASWILVTDAAGTAAVTDGLSLGSGADVFKDKSGQTLRFRSILGVNMSVVEGVDEITLTPTFADSASPGFEWTLPGYQTAGTWLINGAVASNLAGRAVQFANPYIKTIGLRLGAADTFTLKIYEHDTVTYTPLHTITVTGSRTFDATGLNIAVTQGKELAIQIDTGSVSEGIIIALTLVGGT